MKKALSLWENFIKKGSKPENKNTDVFENALIVEKLIEDYCHKFGIRKQPDEWIVFSTDIIKYNTTDKKYAKDGDDFGKEYLQAAKNNFNSLYTYFKKENQSEILKALDNLLILIDKEITTCDLKIRSKPQ
jgi:hypothetical protein